MRFENLAPPPRAPHTPRTPHTTDGPRPLSTVDPEGPLRVHREARLAHEVLDTFIEGADATPGERGAQAAYALRDLALALVELSHHPRGKRAVRYSCQPWELCVERFGKSACLSVYRTGPDPLVAVYDRVVSFDDVVSATREDAARALSDGSCSSWGHAQDAAHAGLASAAEQLCAMAPVEQDDEPFPELTPVSVELDRDSPISFGADFSMRAATRDVSGERRGRSSAPPEAQAACDAVERSDLHALLFRGRMRAEIRGRVVDLGECHPTLVAERLVELSRRALDAWERGLALNARGEASGLVVGVRVSPEGELALTLGSAGGDPRRTLHTFPALGVADMLEAALAFGRSLVRAVLRRDRTQATNLRLVTLRRTLRESTEALRYACQTDSKTNPAPEPYRAFAAALEEARPQTHAPLAATRLRYAPRWRAIVPGLDLRATYLCGDRLVVGAATEMWALDRATGRVLWRTDATRGTSVVTPAGIARLAPDGRLCVHDFGTGETTLRTRIGARVGGPVAGVVVSAPGLPRLVVVTEGEHHLVAVDLTSGETRWRWSWGHVRGRARGAPRMKRAGKLVYFTCGDGALTALDVLTGEVVWRLRDRLRFRTPPTVSADAIYVVSGGAHGVATLYAIDPYSGHARWSTDVVDPSAPCTIEGAPLVAAGSVAVAVRQKSGLALATFRREDGAPLASPARAVAPSGTSWLAVDDAFIGNAPTGEIVAVDAASGELAWRHVLGPRPLEADVPRRLEPVLRCGALFVPCSLVCASAPAKASKGHIGGADHSPSAGVSILRPSDGALLGSIAPSEVIPDLLRVDERCDVYLAEDSGHIAAFGALPRLSLV